MEKTSVNFCDILTPGWPAMSPNVREPNVNGFAGIQTYYAVAHYTVWHRMLMAKVWHDNGCFGRQSGINWWIPRQPLPSFDLATFLLRDTFPLLNMCRLILTSQTSTNLPKLGKDNEGDARKNSFGTTSFAQVVSCVPVSLFDRRIFSSERHSCPHILLMNRRRIL